MLLSISLLGTIGTTLASPYPHALPYALPPSLERRTDPYFPDQPPSCPICAQDYPNINTCAQACPVLANFTEVRLMDCFREDMDQLMRCGSVGFVQSWAVY